MNQVVAKILFVRDHKETGRDLERLLSGTEHKIVTIEGKEAAMNFARMSSVDLIVLSESVFDRAGSEICKEIHIIDEDAPILVCSPTRDESKWAEMEDLKHTIAHLLGIRKKRGLMPAKGGRPKTAPANVVDFAAAR